MAGRHVVMVAMPCAEVVEVDGALDILYVANLIVEGAYDVEVVSPVTTVRAWAGLRLVADRSYRSARGAIDTLIVTGVEPDDARRDQDLIRWVARTAPRVRRVVGLCTGSYVLAEAGLLDGRRATTHGCTATIWRRGIRRSKSSAIQSTFATTASTPRQAAPRVSISCWRWWKRTSAVARRCRWRSGWSSS